MEGKIFPKDMRTKTICFNSESHQPEVLKLYLEASPVPVL